MIPVGNVQAASGSSDEMIYGADIGFLSQLEAQGVQWVDDNGNTRDALELLKEKGVNAVRLRVFVKPPEDFVWTKPDGTTCMLGYTDTPVSYTHLDVYKRQFSWCHVILFFETLIKMCSICKM